MTFRNHTAGDSREYPLVGEQEDNGRTYGGWKCRACGAVHCYTFRELDFQLFIDLEAVKKDLRRPE